MTPSARPRGDALTAPTGGSVAQTIADDRPRVRERALPATPDSARAAREFARTTLHHWEHDELIDDVTLVVSELVTNAVLHGAPFALDCGDGEQPLLLRLIDHTTSVLCTVYDPASTPPRIQDGDAHAEGCRGLLIVAELSTSWGWTRSERRGKTVWAVLAASRQP